ncbi:dynamin family protein [Rossellomorea marisflavi]|uniref:dynamin family protein n=1 Tax=Rossellomorea marisflavi TaxID=189381 RepID=UPI00345B11B3
MKVTVKYNPYKVETQIWVNGEEFMAKTKLEAYKHERLQVWVEDVFEMLIEELNDDRIEIDFIGTKLDFEDMEDIKQGYPTIKLEHIAVEEVKDKFSQLSELVQMMKLGPFEKLRDERIERNFQKALNSEFEIAVIATMSSGKSTLINAMLGHELMPSKNEACTAKVSRIKHNLEAEHYSARAYDAAGEMIRFIAKATIDDFIVLNEDPDIQVIEIEGSLPNIRSSQMNLVLVDTPGPNNSMEGAHRQHTLSVIKSDDKPMVLYVLNATQLRTDDDLALLRTVADAMAVGGKQSKDRFLFAMNKSDEFDSEKGESIKGAMDGVKEYLEMQGIERPNIYPVSAQIAKIIRKKQNGYSLTRAEKANYFAKELFLEDPMMRLNEYAPLSPSLQADIRDEISNAIDEDEAIVHYSGITSIERAINQYLEKYAVTSKVTNAVNTFQRIVEQEDMNNKLEQSILEDAEQRKEIGRVMETIERELEKGSKAQEFKEKIKSMNLKVDKFFAPTHRKIFTLLNQEMNKLRGNSKIGRFEAERLLTKLTRNVQLLQDDLATDLDKRISEILHSTAEGYVIEYKNHIKHIANFESNAIKLGGWEKALTIESVDVLDLIERFSYSQDEKVGTKLVVNTQRKWYTFWRPRHVEEDIYERVEYINMKDVAEEFVLPIEEDISTNIQAAHDFTKSELERLQTFFLGEIDRLEEVLRERVNQIRRLAQENDQLEERMQEKLENQKWLDEFMENLDGILELKIKEGVQL